MRLWMRFGIPLELIALLIVVAFASPVGAASVSEEEGPVRVAANHVDPADCDDIAVGAGGSILVNGVALTAGQLALIDSDVVAALELAAAAGAAASADASACTDVAIVLAPLAVTVNADISVCSVDVTVNGDGTADLGDVTVGSDLLAAATLTVLQLAADADAEACVLVTVTDNEVVVDGSVQLCATATLNADGTLTVNGLDLDVDILLDVNGELDVGVEVEVALAILASVDLTDDSVRVVATVIDIAGCGPSSGGTPSGSASASPSGSASASPSGSASPSPGGAGSGAGSSPLPDTSSPISFDREPVAVGLFCALSLMILISALGVLALGHRRARF